MTNNQAADILLGLSELDQLKSMLAKWAEEIIRCKMSGKKVIYNISIEPSWGSPITKTWAVTVLEYPDPEKEVK